jgi:hypothetical protein
MNLTQLNSAAKFLGRVNLNATEVNEFSGLMNQINSEIDVASKAVIAEHAAKNAAAKADPTPSPGETVASAVRVAVKTGKKI